VNTNRAISTPNRMDLSLIEEGVTLILKGLNVDMKHRNFLETPERVARMYKELFQHEEPNWETFPERYCDVIVFRGHKVWGLCSHHLLPMHLSVSVAYIPSSGRVLGLSKLGRLIDYCNNRPMLQEELTSNICERLSKVTQESTAVYAEGRHLCVAMRGVKSEGEFVTYATSGKFTDSEYYRGLFFDLVRNRK